MDEVTHAEKPPFVGRRGGEPLWENQRLTFDFTGFEVQRHTAKHGATDERTMIRRS